MSINENHVLDSINTTSGSLTINGNLLTTGAGTVSLAQPAATRTTTTSAITTVDTYVTPAFLIAANSLVVGDTFRVKLTGICTNSASGNNAAFTPRFGVAGTTADAALNTFSTTTPAGGTDQPWEAEIEVVVRTIGATGTIFTAFRLHVTSANNGIANALNTIMGADTTSVVDTTAATYLGVSVVGVATTSIKVTSASIAKIR